MPPPSYVFVRVTSGAHLRTELAAASLRGYILTLALPAGGIVPLDRPEPFLVQAGVRVTITTTQEEPPATTPLAAAGLDQPLPGVVRERGG